MIKTENNIVYIAVGPYAWGRHENREKAIKNCKKYLPKNIQECEIFLWKSKDKTIEVSDIGYFIYDKNCESPVLVEKIKFKRRAKKL